MDWFRHTAVVLIHAMGTDTIWHFGLQNDWDITYMLFSPICTGKFSIKWYSIINNFRTLFGKQTKLYILMNMSVLVCIHSCVYAARNIAQFNITVNLISYSDFPKIFFTCSEMCLWSFPSTSTNTCSPSSAKKKRSTNNNNKNHTKKNSQKQCKATHQGRTSKRATASCF